MQKKIITTEKLSVFLLCLILTLIIIPGRQAYAALGGSSDSIASDKKALKAVRSATVTSSKYTVHEFQSGGTIIREYVSSSGIVFGIAWKGLTHPDLTPLLGTYAPEHKKAASHAKRQPGSRHSRIKSDNIVVEKWGHMRNLQGRAYVPALIPEGIGINEIK
ncbi:MAG: DUF2844 domain-containing protein [Deltaproteobacteria bacterium]|nr:DUF2844 domain-containing protein [Deltaproteobacteria bacterium]